jgi:surface protein
MTQETVLIEHMSQLVRYIKNPIKGVRVIIGFTNLARMNNILQKDLTKTLGTEINGHLILASDFLRHPDLDIGNWNVSRVTNMKYTFANATCFDRDISKWDTANVTSMAHMFAETRQFNQPLNNWDVSNVKDMRSMFRGARKFNQPLDNWNTANVTSMVHMFAWADDFNQPLDNWNTTSLVSVKGMLQDSAISEEFIPERLHAIEAQDALLYEYKKEY